MSPPDTIKSLAAFLVTSNSLQSQSALALSSGPGDWPRILFFGSEPPGTGGAGSIYFHRLLRDVPASHLFVATHRPLPDDVERLSCRYLRQSLPLSSLENTRLWKLRFLARLAGLPRLVSLDELDRTIPFVPDVVVTLMQDSLMYETASRYAVTRGYPLCVFVHDLAHGFEPLPRVFQALRQRADRRFLARSASIVCVSDGMKAYLREKWGLESDVILPPAPDHPVSTPPEACRTLKHPDRLTIGYAGGLHYGYGEQLLRIAPALRRAKAHVMVFGALPTGRLAALLNESDVLSFRGRLPTPEDAWREISDNCDATFLPYANPPGSFAEQYRTHFPSKLAEMTYLGLPVIVTGPADASGVSWFLERPGSALCVQNDDLVALERELSALRTDSSRRVSMAQTALSFAPTFSADLARGRLAEVFGVRTLSQCFARTIEDGQFSASCTSARTRRRSHGDHRPLA